MSFKTKTSFPSLLKTYRQRAKKSQEELSSSLKKVGLPLHASDISKLERDERKPPKIEYTIAIIKELQLSPDEAREFLEAGNYPPSAIQAMSFTSPISTMPTIPTPLEPPSYPPITKSGMEEMLKKETPSWVLNADGTLTAANLLAFLIWGSSLEEGIHRNDLLGVNIFKVFATPWNFERIAMPEKEDDFWFVKINVFKMLEQDIDPNASATFRKAIEAHPVLRLIYRNAGEMDLGKAHYNYYLKMEPPGADVSSDEPKVYLRFRVNIYITRGGGGAIEEFAVNYKPANEYTTNFIANEYQRILTDHGEEAYVQRLESFPESYPSFTLDKQLYITSENDAHKKLMQALSKEWNCVPIPVEKLHFIDLLFTPQIRNSMNAVGLWQPTLIRVIGGFKACMELTLNEEPELLSNFERTVAYLSSKYKEFTQWYEGSPIIRLPGPFTYPQYACEIMEKLSPSTDRSTILQFECWLQFPNEKTPQYRETLVPKDKETMIVLKKIVPSLLAA